MPFLGPAKASVSVSVRESRMVSSRFIFFLGGLSSVLLNYATTTQRCANKVDDGIALRRLWQGMLSLVASVCEVQIALEDDTAGVVDSLDLLRSEATTLQADLVDAGIASCLAHGYKWWDILTNKRTALNH